MQKKRTTEDEIKYNMIPSEMIKEGFIYRPPKGMPLPDEILKQKYTVAKKICEESWSRE